MEGPQQFAFNSRRAELAAKFNLLNSYVSALAGIRDSAVYRHSDAVERFAFDRALDAFQPALRTAARCTQAILTFVAGMICWGCNPRWDDFVWRAATGQVLRVHIAGESCVYVSQHCGPFGRAMLVLNTKLMESRLAKQPVTPLPDWSMMADREQLCEWLRSTIAMQPLPSFIRHAPQDLSVRRLAIAVGSDSSGNITGNNSSSKALSAFMSTQPPASILPGAPVPTVQILPTAPPYATNPTFALEPVQDGRRSGFDLGLDSSSRVLHGVDNIASTAPLSLGLIGSVCLTALAALIWRRSKVHRSLLAGSA